MKKIIAILVILACSSAAFANRHLKTNNSSNVVPTTYAALPVLETYVPESVAGDLKNKYGNKLYDITMINASTDQVAYVIRTCDDNGIYTTLSLTGNQVK
jgi:hypothetical protein